MHPQFAEWYRPLMLQSDDKFLKSRWELVEKTAKYLSATMALDLVRLSFGLPVQGDAAMATLKQQLKSESLSYVRATAHLELSLIGDCVLLEALKRSSQNLLWSHVLLAGALSCQQGVRKTLTRAVQKELLVASRALLDSLSVTGRRTTSSSIKPVTIAAFGPEQKPPSVRGEYRQLYSLYPNGNQTWIQASLIDHVEINQGFQQLMAWQQTVIPWVEGACKTLADSVLQQQKAVASALDSPREENEIQWYLFGETSRDLHRPFASFKIAELVPIAASELADLTRMVPGLYAALAYIDRILTQACTREEAESMVSVASIVDAVTPMWKEECVSISGFDGVQDLTPVLCALTYATAGSDDWRTMVPELCQVPIETELPARELAYQLYQEILFARLAKEQLASKGAK